MKYIVVTKTETVATEKGPMVLQKDGQPRLVEDWIANSLMGRGYAIETDIHGNPITEVSAAPVESVPESSMKTEDAGGEESKEEPQGEVIELSSMNIAELRDLARQRNIPDFKKLKKAELLAALTASIAAPPPSSFEPVSLTGNIQPPEFKAE